MSVAGWILSVVTFFMGTIVPGVWERVSYDGISIKQPYQYRALSTNAEQGKEIRFTTLVKIANGRSDSILIDDIRLDPDVVDGVKYTLQKIEFVASPPGTTIYIPFSINNELTLNYLPFLVKSNEERQIAIEFALLPSDQGQHGYDVLSRRLEGSGLLVEIRINGKYRPYSLRVGPNS